VSADLAHWQSKFPAAHEGSLARNLPDETDIRRCTPHVRCITRLDYKVYSPQLFAHGVCVGGRLQEYVVLLLPSLLPLFEFNGFPPVRGGVCHANSHGTKRCTADTTFGVSGGRMTSCGHVVVSSKHRSRSFPCRALKMLPDALLPREQTP